MEVGQFILALALISWLILGRWSGIVFFFGGILVWLGISYYRVEKGLCNQTWALDHSMPVNAFCEVKNVTPEKTK